MRHTKVTTPDGIIVYRRYNKFHRDDGPALIYPNGEERWYKNGKLHREDGPAITRANGNYEWHFNGTAFTFDVWCNILKKTPEEKAKLLLKYA